MMKTFLNSPFWQNWGVMLARLVFGVQFALALAFKVPNIDGTAAQIASVGFPMPVVFAWLAALFELFVVVAFLTGWKIKKAAFLAILYILLLAFLFHGPSLWASNQMEFGFFVDHFVAVAGLLYMLAYGTGNSWKLGKK